MSFYDELNDILWFAPRANLVFRRVPYGFALYVSAGVSNGGRPWRTELTATFRRKSRTFTVAARIFDVIPAEFARNIFALSQLAQMNLPLSGHVEAEFSSEGEVLKASAELTASAGRVGFPGYIARPVEVQEGLIRVDYEPASGDFIIAPSTVRINGGPTELRGRVAPLRDTNGRVRALHIGLEIARGDLARPRRKGEFIIDHLKFAGVARLDAAQLEVEDMQIRAGGAAIRMRGRFMGEKDGVGIYLGGRASNLTTRLVKKLWPPVLAPGARKWIRENITGGVIPRGTFQLAIPASVMTAAIKRDVPIPDKMARVSFDIGNASFRYYEGLPLITGAAGSALMTGNHFTLTLNKGQTLLPSGRKLLLDKGVLRMRDLAAKVSPATVEVRASGRARDFSALLDMKPLRILTDAGFNPDQLHGDAKVRMTFAFPASRRMKPSDVRITASADVSNAVIRGVIKGFDTDGGTLHLVYDGSSLSASGKVKAAGLTAGLQWRRKFGPGGSSSLAISATLTDKYRKKLGLARPQWVRGPMPVTIKARLKEGAIARASVKVDLSKVYLGIPPLSWSRPPVKGTRAAFEADFSNPKRITIRKLNLHGKGLKITGDLTLDADGRLREASFKRLELNSLNRLAVAVKNAKGRLEIAAAGDIFDARPLINSFFSSSPSSAGQSRGAGQPLDITLNLRKVIAERGESIFNLRGEIHTLGSHVSRASLSGIMASGQPVTLDIAPAASGQRRLRIVSNDAGALLRAAGLYSKVHGGRLDFSALLAPPPSSSVRRGLLIMKKFAVRNETRLTGIAREGRGKNGARGPRRGPRRGLFFRKLTLPFSTDEHFLRIGNALIKGDEIGASANGLIRKTDKAMDIGGTIIPAYALNAAIGHVPLLGQILTGGRGQGVFGLTFALRGTMNRPKFLVNPASAIAPGILRSFFDIGGHNVNPDGTPMRRKPKRRNSRVNITGGG